jgi:hypothetical protein
LAYGLTGQVVEQMRFSVFFEYFPKDYLTYGLNTSKEQLSGKTPESLSVKLLQQNRRPGKNIAVYISLK